MTPCQVCGTQNSESTEVCRRCGARLAVSPTMSISPDELAPGDRRRVVGAGSPHNRSPAFNFAPGSMVADRYRVASLLGRGGMGEVYGADDLKLGQRVALKFLPMDRGKSTSWRDQFYAEVRMARQVSHPNVCRVYDVGESDGRLFLSMEFVDGEDLASLLRRIGRLPDDKAIEIAQQLCAGLAAAHRSGVLHRDLKPSNVMIDGKGRARITDFGLAIATSEADRQTGPAGTPGYLAPELLDGAAPSIQSDLYALGLVLYELFTGKKAFDASSVAEFHRKQTETDPTPPSSVVKNFDPVVERAILRCLDRDPAQRPRSALSVGASLPRRRSACLRACCRRNSFTRDGRSRWTSWLAAAGRCLDLPRGRTHSDLWRIYASGAAKHGLGSCTYEQIPGSARRPRSGAGAEAGLFRRGGSRVLGRFRQELSSLYSSQLLRQGLETDSHGTRVAVPGQLLVPAKSRVDDAGCSEPERPAEGNPVESVL